MPRLATAALLAVLGTAACAGTGLDLFGGEETAQTAAMNETCPSYANLDTDGNSVLDLAEYRGNADVLFQEWDDTEDGLLSMDEFDDCMGNDAGEMFAQLDRNGDQMISEDEFLDDNLFAQWDRDGDQALDEDEFLLDDFFI
ncbi:MAG TPA: hypothetical protein VK943_00695 [Arenibaculum sp.]|nr:hypothetical protein [Arenibaculum sp.]